MAFRTLIVAGILYILHSCAQVGILTGGERDTTAPQPIEAKMQPLNGTTNYKGSKIIIPFSEFIKLNKPNETMVMIPPHCTPVATVHKKNLHINWKETLQENTTYILYLNQTVQDFTEGNDSLMQIVFSTGNMIDSLSYEVKVIDAFTNEPLKNCLVALYEGEMDTVKPTYFIKTSASGEAKLNYLKQGTYSLLAFEDVNKDLLLQLDERLAFKSEKIQLDSSFVDSIPLRIYRPKEKEKLTSITYKAPSSFYVGANTSLETASFSVNNILLEKENFEFISEDSLVFHYPPGDSSTIEFVAKFPTFSDTISKRLLQKEKEAKMTVFSNLIDQALFPSDTLTYTFTDFISSIDTTLFQLVNKEDSSEIKIEKILFKQGKMEVLFNRKGLKKVDLIILPKAIKTISAVYSDTIQSTFQVKTIEDFGAIKLDLSDYQQAIVVDVLMNGKLIRSIPVQQQKSILIEELLPNSYSFRVILDDNMNGRWDEGDQINKRYPEAIHSYSEETKIRANWEVEVSLFKKQ